MKEIGLEGSSNRVNKFKEGKAVTMRHVLASLLIVAPGLRLCLCASLRHRIAIVDVHASSKPLTSQSEI